MGWEIDNDIGGKIVDGLKIDVMGFNYIGRAHPLGTCYIELNGIKLGDVIENEYPIQNKKNQGKLRIKMEFTQKKWSDIQAEDRGLVDSLNRKILYLLTMMKKKLSERGLECELSISIALTVVEFRMSIIVGVEELEEAEDEEVNDDVLSEEVTDEVNEDGAEQHEDTGVVKKMLQRSCDKMLNGLSQTKEKMAKLGISGKIGASVMIGAFGCQISIGVDITIKYKEIKTSISTEDQKKKIENTIII